MFAVVLSVCLANDPSVCRDYKLPVTIPVTPLRCSIDAPPYFARWAAEHPMWQIKRWRCVPASQDDI